MDRPNLHRFFRFLHLPSAGDHVVVSAQLSSDMVVSIRVDLHAVFFLCFFFLHRWVSGERVGNPRRMARYNFGCKVMGSPTPDN